MPDNVALTAAVERLEPPPVRRTLSTIVPDVEEHHGRLWGVARVSTAGKLTDRELAGLKEEWKEIAAHGWGVLFSGRYIFFDT